MSAVTAGQQPTPAPAIAPQPRRAWTSYLEVWAPYLLAVLFFGSALYGVNRTDIVDTDAARHAMNGAFIYDLIRTGHILHPIAYAKAYYGHLPSLSMPFHPPLFPAIEAVFFALFGVSLMTARVAVAVMVGLAAFSLYRLVLATFGRPVLAASVTVAAFSFWTPLFVARDVMLEYPAMAFSLMALYWLRNLPRSYPLKDAILFAVFASAALWTKQHTVFLGAVPFIAIVLSRRWRALLSPPLWISSAIFGAAVLGLIRFSKLFHGTGVDQLSTSTRDVQYIFSSTLPAYFYWITNDLRGLPGVLLVAAVLAYAFGWRRRDAERPSLVLYAAWILAVLAILIDLGPISRRYLFFILPATATIAFAVLFHGCRWLWGERRAGIAVALFAAGFLAIGLTIPFDFLRGPGAAAKVIVNGSPQRVLYIGDAEGNFIFVVRSLDSKLQTIVFPVFKLPRKVLERNDLAWLCRRYGIDWIISENVPGQKPIEFQDALPAVAKLEQSVPLQSTRARWRTGSIDVYRFAGNQTQPDGELQISIPKLQEDVPVKP
jgi:4-amino-4-deoxy-L-arabinose transferase-like glycosyltransferase